MESYEMESIMVDGPISYSCWLYTNPEGRPTIIHNFGDNHILRSGCSGKQEAKGFVSIEKLISQTIVYAKELQSAPELKKKIPVVDFFLEAPLTDSYGINLEDSVLKRYGYRQFEDPPLRYGAINRLDDEFRFCLSYSVNLTEKCRSKFPNGRIHAIDIRDVLGIIDEPGKLYIPDIEKKKSKTWQGFRFFVINQIFRVNDENVRNKLYKMYDEIKALSPQELLYPYVSLMDIYLLGRLFRSYEPLPDQNLKSAFNNAPVQNAVIYSGNTHKKNYDKFFEKIGAVELYSFKSPKDIYTPLSKKYHDRSQCIQIPIFRGEYTLPMVEEFSDNKFFIYRAYKQFVEKDRYLSQNRWHRHYAINRTVTNPKTTGRRCKNNGGLFKEQDFPIKKFPKRLRSEEPQAKRQRIEPQEGKEEEP